MSFYPKDALFTSSGKVILLKFIESFIFETDEESRVIDKLKNDFEFGIRTVSGEECRVSTKFIAEQIASKDAIMSIASDIYDKWLRIHKSEESK